ncbi:hypothetical protein B0H66DRAFT_623827 [Apodospora peruviana]|uniref:J domain-containing protein n=1 Tax=Apodospora peruviana TaxID=516989 RepID=A0AAE0M614_9PEZI|nr:hypothetical protein B0H66DRAFT_623827 [Apodospora peruviana]
MVKLDYERDYYADLELSSSADAADVKKQFKKLALKYHPDRNPGREDEVKDKFLVIQTAHEILTDPALKIKFDNYRKRPANRFPGASGVRGNPYSNVAQEMADRFGAPPTRRPQMPTRPTAASGSSSRYSNWGVPPTAKSKAADASDNLRAWDRMRNFSSKGATSSGTSTPAAARPRTEAPKPPQPPPRTASQARRAEAAFGTKKTGYAPASPIGGDEPPVTSRNYYKTNLHSKLFDFDFDDTAANARKPRPASVFVDPVSTQFGGDNVSDNRQRTPYASHIGEKTNPFEGVNRAKSARDSQRPFPEGSDTPPPRVQRQRSASVDESDRFKKSTEKSAFEATNNSPRFQSRASARYSPRGADAASAPTSATFAAPEGSSSSSSSGSQNGRSTYMFTVGTVANVLTAATNEAASSKAKGGPSVYAPFSKLPPDTMTHSHPPTRPSPQSLRPNDLVGEGSSHSRHSPRYPPEKTERSGGTTPSGERPPSRGGGLNVFEKSLHAQLQHLLGKLRTHSHKQPASAHHDGALSPKRTGHRVTKRTNAPHPTSFSIPIDDDTFGTASPSRFMRNSTDNINTRFVDDQKGGESYQFNAGADSPGDAFLRAKQRSRSTPRGRKMPERNEGPESSTESLDNTPRANKVGQQPSAFNPDEWAEKFEPHHFVPPPVARPSTSPTRASRATKKPKPVRMTAGTAGLVDDEDTSSEEKTRPGTAADDFPSGAASPMAMDIDTPPPEPIIPHVVGARTINVEPSKPEWRAGDVNGVTPTTDNNQVGNAGLNVPKMPDLNKTGSEDSADFIRLADFKNVAPFAPSNQTGLGSLNDLASNLPFESRPSAKLPLSMREKHHKTAALKFPHPPAAPRPPTVLGVSNLKPSAQTWQKYVLDFQKYLQEWTVFNKRIVEHFVARQRVIEEKGPGWVAGGGEGIHEYLHWLEEDKMVRQKWLATCDAHELYVREMGKGWERMKAA